MKATYLERIERRTAFSRKMYCANCGEHEYEIVEQLEPYTSHPWVVRCPHCGAESDPSMFRESAIARWKES